MFSSHKESTPILQSSFPEPWPPRIPSWCSTEDALFLAQADCIGQTLHTLTVATTSLSSRYYGFLHAVEKDSEMTFSDLVAQNSSELLMVSGRAFEVQASGTSSLVHPPHPCCAAVATLPFLCKFPKVCYHFAPHVLVAQQAPFVLNFLGGKGAFSPKPSYKAIQLLGDESPAPQPSCPPVHPLGL